MNSSKVSIIIPVYQKRNYIEKCVDSLIKQTYKDIEILLIDDGSSDGSNVICDNLSKQYSFIKTIHQKNNGVSSARNKGIKFSSGKYILFLDSDDFIVESSLEELVNAIEKTKTDIAIFDFVYFNENRNDIITTDFKSGVYSEKDIIELFWNMFNKCIAHNVGTKLYKSEIIKNNNIFFYEEYSIFEDINFFLEYLTKIDNVYYLKKELYFYYSHTNGSLRSNYKKNFIKAHKDVYMNIEILLNKYSKFDKYKIKFYQNYMYGISEALINEYSENKNNCICDDIFNDDNVDKSREILKNLSMKQKILYNMIWNKKAYLIKFFMIVFVRIKKFKNIKK